MRRTDITLRWLEPVPIEEACRELSLVTGHFGIVLGGYSFAIQEAGPYIHGRSMQEVIRQETHITTGGGWMRDAAGAEWATFSVENLCETPRAGFTFEIRLRRNCTLYPSLLQESEIPSASELTRLAQHAAQVSSARVVYGLDVGAYKACFSHPDPGNEAVVIWLARDGLSKLPCLGGCGRDHTQGVQDHGGWHLFADRAGKVISIETLDSNDRELLTNRCKTA